jgi:hypothetical protein
MRKSATIILVLVALLGAALPALAAGDGAGQSPTIFSIERVVTIAMQWWGELLDKARADVTGNGLTEPPPEPDPTPPPDSDEARADVTGNG